MTRETDPEVVADMQLRARTERDRGRGAPSREYVRPSIEVTCGWCGKPTLETAESLEILRTGGVPPACATCLGSRSERERAQRQQRAQDTAAARAAQSQQALPLAPAKRPRRSP